MKSYERSKIINGIDWQVMTRDMQDVRFLARGYADERMGYGVKTQSIVDLYNKTFSYTDDALENYIALETTNEHFEGIYNLITVAD